jgi:hypothetical protein
MNLEDQMSASRVLNLLTENVVVERPRGLRPQGKNGYSNLGSWPSNRIQQDDMVIHSYSYLVQLYLDMNFGYQNALGPSRVTAIYNLILALEL